MIAGRRKSVVILGMMSKMPVPGNIWLVLQYLIGFERLGFDAYYVEAHGSTPRGVMAKGDHDGASKAAVFIDGIMKRFDLSDRWAFHSRYEDRYFGMSEAALRDLYASADLLINLHGSTVPLDEHAATGRLIYLETDPVELEIEVYHQDERAVKFLEPHVAFFTWGLNFGGPDCKVPQDPRFHFHPSPPPVIMDFWQPYANGSGALFTTVGNWRQRQTVTYQGEVYHWSKDREFLKFIDLPARVGPQFELALSSVSRTDADVELLEAHGWRVRDSLAFSSDLDRYREYITGSHGEFTVAKDQNVRLRSGWFSERSAQYLAAGRPVITQDTGFGNMLPTGQGLFPFLTVEEAASAVEEINADYDRHSRAAAEVAREHFSHDVVLRSLLDRVGLTTAAPRGTPPVSGDLPRDLVILPTARWPVALPQATVDFVRASPAPMAQRQSPIEPPDVPHASIVVVSHDNLVLTKLCLASVLANTEHYAYEVIVVDNGSTDGTGDYLRDLADRHPHVRVLFNDSNRGFAPAINHGLSLSTGAVLVLLNNDTIVPPGWLGRLVARLDDPAVGLVGPVTNRAGNEAEIEISYSTYGEFVDFAHARASGQANPLFDIRVATMFCAALRRNVWERVGPLDEQFVIGLFEDDDYAMRVREAGYRVVCAEDTFVHHFGQGSIGKLGPTGQYGGIFHANRARWEAKWRTAWQPYRRRPRTEYAALVERICRVVCEVVPPDATVLVISKGDDDLLKLGGRRAWHFLRCADGTYAGYNPADSEACIEALEDLRAKGGSHLVVPATMKWWLDYYGEFRRYLSARHQVLLDAESCMILSVA